MPSEKNIIKVKELQDTFSKARAVYFTEYHGLDVENITKLRSEFYKAKIEYKVAKNTLLKLALAENSIEGIEDILNGSTAIAVSYDGPVAPAKVIKNFNKRRTCPQNSSNNHHGFSSNTVCKQSRNWTSNCSSKCVGRCYKWCKENLTRNHKGK